MSLRRSCFYHEMILFRGIHSERELPVDRTIFVQISSILPARSSSIFFDSDEVGEMVGVEMREQNVPYAMAVNPGLHEVRKRPGTEVKQKRLDGFPHVAGCRPCGVKSRRFLATVPVRPCYRLGLEPRALALKARTSHREINDFHLPPLQPLSTVIKPLQPFVL